MACGPKAADTVLPRSPVSCAAIGVNEGATLVARMRRQAMALAATVVVCLTLPSCSSFSNLVSDNVPMWAGGMPKDVPPRPGAPGYDDFIAHQQGNAAATPAPVTAPVTTNTLPPNAAAVPTTTVARQPMPAPGASPNAQSALPPSTRRPDDQAAVQGGLY
jgi:hypothetical protein